MKPRGVAILAALLLVPACGGSSSEEMDPPGGGDPDARTAGGRDGGDDIPTPDAPTGTAQVGSCGDPAPPGAPVPPPLPTYSGGSCPALVAGRNTITSSGSPREFVMVVPDGLDPGERPPVLFVWHHIGGDAMDIVEKGELQQSANTLRVIAVVPEKKGDVELPLIGTDLAWPYLDLTPDSRVEEEAVFFDDMLACVAAAYPIDQSCISTAGVSAGGLWTSLLIQRRSERLANAIVLSGGTGPALGLGIGDVRPWAGAPRKLPVLVLWGGDSDQCVVNFDTASTNLEMGLVEDGHFLVECVHNCGHAVPPVDPAVGMVALWRFALDHPYWLAPGASSYAGGVMPAGTPEWCGVGAGGATPRTGMCTMTSADSGCPALP